MKQKLLLLSFLLFAFQLNAQTLTASEILAVPGETFKMHYVKNAATLNPGNAGLNQTWDFSNALFAQDTIKHTLFMEADNTPYTFDYPNANIAEKITLSHDTSYVSYNYYNDSSGFRFDLGANFGILVSSFSNPQKLFQFPMNFNSTVTDDYCFTTDAFSITNYYCGNSNVSFDGTGTLILPFNTYSGVVRIKNIEKIVNLANTSDTTVIENYYWFVPGIHKPFFTYQNYSDASGYISLSATIIDSSVFAGMAESKNFLSIKLYPNPANDLITIKSEKIFTRIEIFNMLGVSVIYKNEKANQLNFSVENISVENYFMKITDEKNNSVFKQISITR